jgi:hypothetical protein
MNSYTSIQWKRFSVLLLVVVLASVLAAAKTSLKVNAGSSETPIPVTNLSLNDPKILQFFWSSDQAGVVGGKWQVIATGKGMIKKVVAQGQATPAPTTGGWEQFTIPINAFLAKTPPSTPGVTYTVVITPYNAQNKPLDSGSNPVHITQSDKTGPVIKLDIPVK